MKSDKIGIYNVILIFYKLEADQGGNRPHSWKKEKRKKEKRK